MLFAVVCSVLSKGCEQLMGDLARVATRPSSEAVAMVLGARGIFPVVCSIVLWKA